MNTHIDNATPKDAMTLGIPALGGRPQTHYKKKIQQRADLYKKAMRFMRVKKKLLS